MNYPEPTKQFDALDHARNKVIRANQFQELVISQFKSAYEDFWGLSADGDSRYSVAEMQSILDVMPQSTAIDILQDAGAMVQYLSAAYPNAVDAKYMDAAWDYTIGQNGITVTALKDVWKKKEEKTDEPVVE